MSFAHATTILDAAEYDVAMMDPDNPKSMLNRLPDQVRGFAAAIPRRLFTISERSLREKADPDFTLKCLRINFWQAYCSAQDRDRQMTLASIITGVTTREYFLHMAKTEPEKLAFVMVPPKSYDVMQRQIFEDSLERLKDILEMDLVDEQVIEVPDRNGGVKRTTKRKINTGAISEIRKVAEMLSDRLQGSVTQKIAVQGQMAHAHAQISQSPDDPGALGGIDNMLKMIESKLEGVGDVIDVEGGKDG